MGVAPQRLVVSSLANGAPHRLVMPMKDRCVLNIFYYFKSHDDDKMTGGVPLLPVLAV